MLTYELEKSPGLPLYESLYRCIRQDIVSGIISPGERLPSKRALAENLKISKATVENAYAQLVAEGFLCAREKVGYFAESITPGPAAAAPVPSVPPVSPKWAVDLTSDATATGFPFSVWMRLQRQVMLDYGDTLLAPLPGQGIPELQQAIASYLRAFRNMTIDPCQILIGAGTDFLYNLLIQLLGQEKLYAVEEPGYGKTRQVYLAGGVRCISVPMDDQGVRPDALEDAQVLHCSPSHHFPSGIVTSLKRRRQLLDWASGEKDRWIIEDDYDSEFRFYAHPMPTLQSMDPHGRVIYLNTFSKTLAPSIRISYMILPPHLMELFHRKLGFYSCTVPSFEQYTLARFLSQGYFEKHINRMRRFYRSRRNNLIDILRHCPFSSRITILEKDSGLHFLLRVDTNRSDRELVNLCAMAGIRIRALSTYYLHQIPSWAQHCLVVNYSGLDEENLPAVLENLCEILESHH